MKNHPAILRTVISLMGGIALAARALADPAPPPGQGVEAYAAWLNGCLTALEQNLTTVSASAEAAARRYVHEDYRIAAAGERWFTSEALGRAGGLMRLEVTDRITAADPRLKYLVLFHPRADHLADDTALIQRLRQLDQHVIGFGRKELLQAATAAGAVFDAVVETFAEAHGGLFQDGRDAWVVPTDPTAGIAALWVWTAEFVAACMREGRMPALYQSIKAPGGLARNAALKDVSFHDSTPPAVAAGTFGRAYLNGLRAKLNRVGERERNAIIAAAELARKAMTHGQHLHAYFFAHALVNQLPCPNDPGYFTQINRWTRLKPGTVIADGDVVLCIGYDALFRGNDEWGAFAENTRAAGGHLIWSLTDYNRDEIMAIAPDEIFINQHWTLGDAMIVIPGYDIRAFPASGVIAQAILWMLHAEMFMSLQALQPPGQHE